jgi:hypothetical protein
LLGRYRTVVPGDLPPGGYDLYVRLPNAPHVLLGDPDARRPDGAVGAPIGRIEVDAIVRRFEAPATVDIPTSATWGERVSLLGLDLAPTPLAAGAPFTATLWWRGDRAMATRFKVFVHLDTPDGFLLAQDDAEPAAGDRPTTGWLPGEVVADAHRIAPDTELPPGDYVLGVGLYDPGSGDRLPLRDAQGNAVPDDKLRIPIRLR